MPETLLRPVPHTEAADYLRSKPAVSRAVFDALLPELRARAFVITGVESLNALQSVREQVAQLPQGGDWEELRDDVAERISPWTDPDPERLLRRAELVLRMQGFQAYAAAQHEVLERQREAFPWWQYNTAGDERVRDSHAALDGVVMPADSPFWEEHYPPWDWGCRCYITPLTDEEVGRIRAGEAEQPPEARRVLEGSRLREAETSGRLMRALPGDGGLARPYDVRAPSRRAGGSGFAGSPGTLRMSADELRERYDSETWERFLAWAERTALPEGGTVREWLEAG